jgi:hypothetical protein
VTGWLRYCFFNIPARTVRTIRPADVRFLRWKNNSSFTMHVHPNAQCARGAAKPVIAETGDLSHRVLRGAHPVKTLLLTTRLLIDELKLARRNLGGGS